MARKRTNKMNRQFSKKEIKMATNHMKSCTPSLLGIAKEMQIKLH